jgi:hypothetical protein
MNENAKLDQALPHLSDSLYEAHDKAQAALNEYFKWAATPEMVSGLIDQVEYATLLSALPLKEISHRGDLLNDSVLEVEDTISMLTELTTTLNSLCDGVKLQRLEYCRGNCPLFSKLDSFRPYIDNLN